MGQLHPHTGGVGDPDRLVDRAEFVVPVHPGVRGVQPAMVRDDTCQVGDLGRIGVAGR
jgi:hypothetical protein